MPVPRLPLLVVALAATVALAVAAALPQEPARRGTTFTGTSDEGDFQAALAAAVARALEAATHPEGRPQVSDAMVDWELERVAGRQGGIAGFQRVEVTIRVAR